MRGQVKGGSVNTATNRSDVTLAEQLIAAQDWWREAGVDQVFHDAPLAMLGAVDEPKRAKKNTAKSAQTSERAQEPVVPALDPASLPASLADFRRWWLDQKATFPGATVRRIAPIGSEGAKLMLVLPMPEIDDTETLLSGPQGVLLRNVLRALGLAADEVYFATALPSHTPMPDWADLDRAGLGIIMRHHIALAKPGRVLALGEPLAHMFGLQANQTDQSFTHGATKTPALAARASEHLLSNARQRARLWHTLLQWTQPR